MFGSHGSNIIIIFFLYENSISVAYWAVINVYRYNSRLYCLFNDVIDDWSSDFYSLELYY